MLNKTINWIKEYQMSEEEVEQQQQDAEVAAKLTGLFGHLTEDELGALLDLYYQKRN